MININSNIDNIIAELRRLANPMGNESSLPDKLEAVLITQFQITQRAVHIQTGSLRSSGDVDSRQTRNSWRGSISYGGSSSGIHNPVRYAGHELERGGTHNYMSEAVDFGRFYGPAIISWMRGE